MLLSVADWVAIGTIAVVIILGLVVGFSGGLKFFTGGIFGVIISLVATYFLLGLVNSWQFVIDLLAKLNGMMSFSERAEYIIDQIVLAVILFVVVQLLRLIVVKLIAGIFEIDMLFFKIINRLFGIVIFAALFAAIGLVAFQVIYWVGGNTAEQVSQSLQGSIFRLDWVYENNPLRTMVDYFIQ